MSYTTGQMKVGCSTCNIDTAPCAGTTELPAAANNLTGYNYSGFEVTDYAGSTLQSFNVKSGEFSVEKYLDIMKNGTFPLFTQFMGKYRALSRLLFDIDDTYDKTKYETKLGQIAVFKDFKDAPVLASDDGTSFIFSEQAYDDVIAYVARDETNSNSVLLHDGSGAPIVMNNPKFRGLYEVGKTIMITSNGSSLTAEENPDCCAEMVQRLIVGMNIVNWTGPLGAMDYVQLVLEEGDLPVKDYKGINQAPNDVYATLNDEFGSIYKGDSVRSLYKSRNDCDTITGDSNDLGMSMKKSYIQHFGKSLTFKKYEFNKSYATEDGALSFIRVKMGAITRMLMEEMAYAFYMGQNRGPNATAITYTNPMSGKVESPGSETMGLIPSIHYANILKPHLKIITSMKSLNTPEEKASLLVDQLIQVQQSGAVEVGDKIVMLMDTRGFSTYNKLLNAFTKLTGAVYQVTDNKRKEFVEPELFTPYGTVEIMTCPIFERLFNNSGNILFLPKKLIMVTQRENQSWNIDSGGIEKATMGFSSVDISLPKDHECKYYDIYGEIAIILGLTDSGAYRWIQNAY